MRTNEAAYSSPPRVNVAHVHIRLGPGKGGTAHTVLITAENSLLRHVRRSDLCKS